MGAVRRISLFERKGTPAFVLCDYGLASGVGADGDGAPSLPIFRNRGKMGVSVHFLSEK